MGQSDNPLEPYLPIDCPRCDETPRATETAIRPNLGIVDVGWRCIWCEAEWGFEVLQYPGDADEENP